MHVSYRPNAALPGKNATFSVLNHVLTVFQHEVAMLVNVLPANLMDINYCGNGANTERN